MQPFEDRRHAGHALAEALAEYAGRADLIVLALPRGGVPIGYEVATRLDVELDILLVRKLGMPGHEEFAIGAIASGGIRVLNEEVLRHHPIPEPVLQRIEARERIELLRREQAYRGGRPPLDVTDKTVILVDDGLATGTTMRAAVVGLRMLRPASIVVAVPVAGTASCRELGAIADRVICVHTPEPFGAVGLWYQDFTQTTDKEVRRLLALVAGGSQPPPSREERPAPGR